MEEGFINLFIITGGIVWLGILTVVVGITVALIIGLVETAIDKLRGRL